MLLLKRALASSAARRVLMTLGMQLAVLVILGEDEEAAVGLAEQVEQAVGDLGQQRVQLQRLATGWR